MAAHTLLETQLHDLRQCISTGDAVFSAQTMHFLKDWLVTHIQTLDKNLCHYLANHPDQATEKAQ
jgi:hemerythrin